MCPSQEPSDQAVALIVMAIIGILPYFGVFGRYADGIDSTRGQTLFARWWLALWAAPGVMNLVLTGLLG